MTSKHGSFKAAVSLLTVNGLFSANTEIYFLIDKQRGHIKTSTESFFIQPVEQYSVENPNILHKITRERKIIDHPLGDDIFQGSQCDTCKDKGE